MNTTLPVRPAPLFRPLSEVATQAVADLQAQGHPVPLRLAAMRRLRTTDLSTAYGPGYAGDAVLAVLATLDRWQGPVADRIKTELRAALADYAQRLGSEGSQ